MSPRLFHGRGDFLACLAVHSFTDHRKIGTVTGTCFLLLIGVGPSTYLRRAVWERCYERTKIATTSVPNLRTEAAQPLPRFHPLARAPIVEGIFVRAHERINEAQGMHACITPTHRFIASSPLAS
jgi:hypothetical protein